MELFFEICFGLYILLVNLSVFDIRKTFDNFFKSILFQFNSQFDTFIFQERSEVESDFMSYITNSNLHSVISNCVFMCFESGAQNPGRFLRDYFSKSSDQENAFLREEIKDLKSQIKQLKLRPNFESPTNLLEENMRLKEDSESLKSQIILMDQQIIDSDNEKTLIDKKIDSQNQPKIQQKRSRIDKGEIKKRSATRKGIRKSKISISIVSSHFINLQVFLVDLHNAPSDEVQETPQVKSSLCTKNFPVKRRWFQVLMTRGQTKFNLRSLQSLYKEIFKEFIHL